MRQLKQSQVKYLKHISIKALKANKQKISIFFIGLISLIWFLVRVIPKPSRAAYPCQRAAFPIASAFAVWITSSIASITLFKNAKNNLLKNKPYKSALIFTTALIFVVISFLSSPITEGIASSTEDFQPGLVERVPIKKFTPSVIDQLPASVAIVKSEKSNASNVSEQEIETMIIEAINLAGGFEETVKDAQTVVLKPNLVGVANADLTRYTGHITNNTFVEVIAKLVKNINSEAEVIVIEGSAGKTEECFSKLEYDKIKYIDGYFAMEEICGNWRDYKSDELVAVNLPDNKALYPDNKKPNKSRAIYIAKKYYEADVIISIPVLKNHSSAGITGAVKNVGIGSTPASIYGASTTNALRSNTIDHDDKTTNLLHQWIHDFYSCKGVDYAVMDGIQGLQRGPGYAGQEHEKNMRLVLAGKDAVAMDAIAGLLMQHDPSKVNHLVYLHNDQLGIADPGLIEVVGEKVNENRKKFDHNRDQTKYSMFTKTNANNYDLTYSISGNNLNIQVLNNDDLARIELEIDGQKVPKYIVHNFDNVDIDINDISVVNGELNVTFYDKYHNLLTKSYTAPNNINKIKNNDLLKVYPTVAKNQLTIETDQTIKNYSIKIISTDGKTLITKDFNSNNNIINIGQLQRGNYLIRLTDENNIQAVQKFIKQ